MRQGESLGGEEIRPGFSEEEGFAEACPVEEARYEEYQKRAQAEAETMGLEELRERAFKLTCRCLVRIEQKLSEMYDRPGENDTLGRAMAIAGQIRQVKESDTADPGAYSELQQAAEERITGVEIDSGDRGGGAREGEQ